MLLKLIVIAVFFRSSLGASFVPCPDTCRCELPGTILEKIGVECTSFGFLNRLIPKQISAVVKVNITGTGLTNIDPKLKILKHLESLDLSDNRIASTAHFPSLPKLTYLNLRGNHLKQIQSLPRNIETLDVTSNYIRQIDEELSGLERLKSLNLFRNPIECNCEAVLHYNKLAEAGVKFETPVKCSSPKTFKDKDLKFINCSMIADDLLNHMMNDQSFDEENVIADDDGDSDYSEDRAYLRYSKDTDKIAEDDKTISEVEGSGDEGSGDSGIIIDTFKEDPPVACHTNCSTLPPIGIYDENNASPPPTIQESAKILFEDILGKSESEEKPKPVEETIVKHKTDVQEQVPVKEREELANESDKTDVESVATKDVVPGEMERAVVGPPVEDSNLPYYVLGGIFAALVALLVVVAMKKRNKRNSRRKDQVKENGHYEEMKPLKSNGKPEEKTIPKTPENTPLIGEENGKIPDIDPLKTYIQNEMQRAEPKTPTDNGKAPETDQLQESPKSDTLKVTIKASEITDSIPRTPLLVHRQLNNDGNYTTTLQPSP